MKVSDSGFCGTIVVRLPNREHEPAFTFSTYTACVVQVLKLNKIVDVKCQAVDECCPNRCLASPRCFRRVSIYFSARRFPPRFLSRYPSFCREHLGVVTRLTAVRFILYLFGTSSASRRPTLNAFMLVSKSACGTICFSANWSGSSSSGINCVVGRQSPEASCLHTTYCRTTAQRPQTDQCRNTRRIWYVSEVSLQACLDQNRLCQ